MSGGICNEREVLTRSAALPLMPLIDSIERGGIGITQSNLDSILGKVGFNGEQTEEEGKWKECDERVEVGDNNDDDK